MKKCFLFLLISTLLLCSFAAAETAAPAIDPCSMTLVVGSRTYTLPLSASELTEMGITLPDLSGLTEGRYYPDAEVHDGRNGFSLRFDYFPGEIDLHWATGVSLNSEDHAGMSICGLVLGKTTQKEIVAAFGPDSSGATTGSNLSYYFRKMNYIFHLTFDDNAVLSKANVRTETLTTFGPVEAAAPATEELPDPTTMPFNSIIVDGVYYQAGDTVQKLLDNGWHLPVSINIDDIVEPSEGYLLNGGNPVIYNGKTAVKITYANTTDEAIAVKDCVINEFNVESDFGTEIIAADGIQPGVSTLADAKALFGEIKTSYENTHTFGTLNNTVNYDITVDADNNIIALAIRGLMN